MYLATQLWEYTILTSWTSIGYKFCCTIWSMLPIIEHPWCCSCSVKSKLFMTTSSVCFLTKTCNSRSQKDSLFGGGLKQCSSCVIIIVCSSIWLFNWSRGLIFVIGRYVVFCMVTLMTFTSKDFLIMQTGIQGRIFSSDYGSPLAASISIKGINSTVHL